MKVLFVSPEVNPIVRMGGLGDVVGSLPIALTKLGVDIRIICPFYPFCKRGATNLISNKLKILLGKKSYKGKLYQATLKNDQIPVYLVDLPYFFNREGVYSDKSGDFKDNPQRAFALCQAAIQIDKMSAWKPDIIHAHDWMAAPVCAYLNAEKAKSEKFDGINSVLTIHNLQHQGVYSYEDFVSSGLPDNYWTMDGFEHYGQLNLLKGGIQHADKITTVSPTYAEEIRSEKFGCGLETSLQYRGADLIGILNGIDEEAWNPQNDPTIAQPISQLRPKAGKLACKSQLLSEFKMDPDSDAPLFGVVSRLFDQKGLDLLIEVLPQMMAQNHGNFVILGSGDATLEKSFQELSLSFPKRIGTFIGFDDGLARRVFSGSDFFIMPSRFEPCGLAQQYAMKYGSLPIARKTGGLADTISPIAPGEKCSTGFLFSDASAKSLWTSIQEALEVFANKRKFSQMRKNALSLKCGWENAAIQYLQTYEWAIDE